MKLTKIFIIILFLGLFLSLIGYVCNAETIDDFYKEVILNQNHLKVTYSSELSESDEMTFQQAEDRLGALLYWSNELSTQIHPRRMWKDLVPLILTETNFVNYMSLDQGRSFGWISIRKTTVNHINKYFGFEEYSYNEILNSDFLQGKYAAAKYEMNLRKLKSRDKAIVAYNRGMNGVTDGLRWEKYFFEIFGRIKYYEQKYEESK